MIRRRAPAPRGTNAAEKRGCVLARETLTLAPMSNKHPAPGVSRTDRLSEEGLQRLRNHLARGMSQAVRNQWIARYGEAARLVIEDFENSKAKK